MPYFSSRQPLKVLVIGEAPDSLAKFLLSLTIINYLYLLQIGPAQGGSIETDQPGVRRLDWDRTTRGVSEARLRPRYPSPTDLLRSTDDQRSLLSDFGTYISHLPAMSRGLVTTILSKTPNMLSLEQDLYSKATPTMKTHFL